MDPRFQFRGALRAGAALAALLVVGLGAGATVAAPLVSYRAIYDLALARSDQGGGVVDLSGRFVFEFEDACDGYTTAQRVVVQTTNADGASALSDFSTTSWEARDGLRYRFNVRQDYDGQRSEEFAGQARLRGRAKGGSVAYSRPNEDIIDLPIGTMFPAEHTMRLVQAGQAGKGHLVATVFDGSTDEGLYGITAFIGKGRTDKVSDITRQALKGVRSWPVRLAYFLQDAQTEAPLYEFGFRLYENGVSDDLVLDYGDYAMKGTMILLEVLPAPRC